MPSFSVKQQRGYVLMITLLMFMGIGGAVLASFTKEARRDFEERKYQHNQQVLAEAKQALLMFAYNYPQTTGGGPGRLPCPDQDNDGLIEFPPDCSAIGRFPWGDPRIGTNELLDASGETLWYAVSNAFDNVGGGGVINSDTLGTITLLDSAGQVLYDGSVDGIAAVIIAPGVRLRRDNDGDGTYEALQLRDTPIRQTDPTNYLDTYTIVGAPNRVYDNSVFVDGENDSDDDGLLLGPIFDPVLGDIVVNDQMIVITAEEVIAMAEKAVIETYRDAIRDYRETLWPVANDRRYPWLAAYGNTQTLDIYDARPGDNVGRVPFLNYYSDIDTHTVITNVQIDFDVTLAYTSMVDNDPDLDPGFPGVVDNTYIDEFSSLFTGFPAGTQTVTINNASLSFSSSKFDGTVSGTDNAGTMISVIGGGAAIDPGPPAPPSNIVTRYFWDGGPGFGQVADGWELCPVVTGDVRDCTRNGALSAFEAFQDDWDDHGDMRIRKIELELYVDPEFVIELAYPAPVPAAPVAPDGANNARFTTTFPAAGVPVVSVADDAEGSLRNFIDIRVNKCEQDNNVGSTFSVPSHNDEPGDWGDPADGGTTSCDAIPVPNITVTLNNNFVITSDWYPQLPSWIADNGWDDAVMMSFAADFGPGQDGICSAEDGDTGTGNADDCIVVTNLFGGVVNNNIEAVLVHAGEHDLVDGDDWNGNADYSDAGDRIPDNILLNDLHDIFEPENYSNIGAEPVINNDPTPASDTELPLVFDKREETVPGNAPDTVFVIN